MNIHPILVHFPIALLTIYTLLEIMPFNKIRQLPYWFYTKAIILIIGTLSAIPTLFAGFIIKDLFGDQKALVNLHANFAIASTLVYSLLSLVYLYSWVKKTPITYPILISFFSLLGLLLLLITGALGGTIVYGPNLDLFTSFTYHLFFH